ncbi:hypothetical protein P3T76_009268 [Phytophthora citrophthora]|uniref:Uncharacterized protein n=1 Tax=Phytophthora citrophthora TaxID=4793 RepID=A0AAD9GH87_9STRA|nr:hypothetical protein P3T76_009268 [Phytophthora citrophthora]
MVCATDADELALTHRQVVSTFSHLEVQTCSPTTKTVGHVHLLEDVPDALVRVLVERVEVFTEGSTEEHGILWDDGEAASLMVAMSTSSMSTRPLSKSQIRKSAIMRDDFPAPVRPQIPTFSPAATSKLTPLSTSGSSGRYRRQSWSKRMVPRTGHEWTSFSLENNNLSTLVMALSVRSTERITHCTIDVSMSEYVSERPAVNEPTDPAVVTR